MCVWQPRDDCSVCVADGVDRVIIFYESEGRGEVKGTFHDKVPVFANFRGKGRDAAALLRRGRTFAHELAAKCRLMEKK